MEETVKTVESNTYKSFPFFRILYRNLTMIIVIILALTVLGGAYGFLRVKPVYSASCDVIFNVKQSNSDTLSVNTSFAKTYLRTITTLINSPRVEEEAKKTDKYISRGAVSVNSGSDSLIITLSYTSDDPAVAKTRLDAYIAAADSVLQDTLPTANTTRISFEKLQNDYRVSKYENKESYIIIGFVGGVVIGVALSVLIYLLDNKMKDKDEVEEIVGASLLAYIEKQ